MANMNFQDQPGDKPQKPAADFDDPKVDDLYVDSPSGGTRFVWVAIVVIIIAAIGGGVFLLNKYGYLNFLRKRHTVTVVTSNPPPPVAMTNNPKIVPPAVTPKPLDKFSIQVSAFKSKPMAEKYAAKLKRNGMDAYVLASNVPNGETWFKVCVGSYGSKLQAIAATQELKEKTGADVWVVPTQ